MKKHAPGSARYRLNSLYHQHRRVAQQPQSRSTDDILWMSSAEWYTCEVAMSAASAKCGSGLTSP